MATVHDFDLAFELTVDQEGGYSDNPNDPGNWTSGIVRQGELKGTKYGISAASFPELDIKNLTLAQAKSIYEIHYWTPAGCPDCNPRLAYVVFDAAVVNGVGRAVGWLQKTVGSGQDGVYGPETKGKLAIASANDRDDIDLAAEVHSQRIYFMAGLDIWNEFGLGWSRRLARVAMQDTFYWPQPPVSLAEMRVKQDRDFPGDPAKAARAKRTAFSEDFDDQFRKSRR